MNDADHDAWLREALRHAPDAEALPPSGVSDAILAQARAAARTAAPISLPARREAARPSAFAAFWAWLARPPVAAGFASVMAATLVGLMWWDRPLDETLPQRPEASGVQSEGAIPRAQAPSPAPSPAQAPVASLQGGATGQAAQAPVPATTGDAREEATALKRAPAESRRAIEPPASANAVLDAKRSRSDAPAPARRTDALANSEAARKPGALANDDIANQAGRLARREAPAPFPAAAPAEPATLPPRAAALPSVPAALPSLPPALPSSPAAPPSPRTALAPPVPLPSARKDAEVAASTASTDAAAAPAAKRTPAPRDDSAPARETRERAFAGPSASALRQQRGDNSVDQADKSPAAFGAPPAAAFRGKAEGAQRGSAIAAVSPLAPVLAAIAADPGRWSRQTASGERLALDAGWREWLGALDAAAGTGWRALAEPSAPAENEAARTATTLQLVEGGRLAASIRLERSTVRVDAAPGSGIASGQATLTPAAAERLRKAAELLAR